MRKLSCLAFLIVASAAHAETTYLAMYMQGQKIGYSAYTESNARLDGKAVKRTDSKTLMGAGLLGESMQIQMDSSSWSTPAGNPLKMTLVMTSAGRSQKVNAVFGAKTVTVDVDNSGKKFRKNLTIPADGRVVDDPMNLVVSGRMAAGSSRKYYVLDPMTVSFVKNEVKFVGKTSTVVRGKKVTANLIEILDPRAGSKVYISAKGDLVRVEGPMGIEMLPVSKREAIGNPATNYRPNVDLALVTSLKPDKPLAAPETLKGLKLRVSGADISRLPSDTHQTVTKDGSSWLLDVHPERLDSSAPSAPIAVAAKQKPEWTKAAMNIPSDSPQFKALAKQAVGNATDVVSASRAIRKFVHSNMRPNAGIGVLRDATEVWKTKEGVCRDYATLTVTLMRSAGMPARLTSGLVCWDGAFYYHAWAEAWDGGRWVAFDSTVDRDQVTPSHIKLGHGNVEDAFNFTFLGKAKLEVLEQRKD